MQHKYFQILQMFFAILKISLDLLFTYCWKTPVFLSKWHFFTSHWWNASQISFNTVIPAAFILQ